jgi:hypothetical protein
MQPQNSLRRKVHISAEERQRPSQARHNRFMRLRQKRQCRAGTSCSPLKTWLFKCAVVWAFTTSACCLCRFQRSIGITKVAEAYRKFLTICHMFVLWENMLWEWGGNCQLSQIPTHHRLCGYAIPPAGSWVD